MGWPKRHISQCAQAGQDDRGVMAITWANLSEEDHKLLRKALKVNITNWPTMAYFGMKSLPSYPDPMVHGRRHSPV
jgi:hypothetical protein